MTLREHIQLELETDRIGDDVTSVLLGVKAFTKTRAQVVSKAAGVFSGMAVLCQFEGLFPQIQWARKLEEGDRLQPGSVVVDFEAPLGMCLGIERTLLNYLSHASGVATLTRRFVESVSGTPTKILATRKTLPGLKDLQLTAVKAGGGYTHRRSLSDGILIKDNHSDADSPAELIARARQMRSPLHRIEVEVQSLEQLKAVLKSQPDIIMLDNLSMEEMREAVSIIGNQAEIEVSGGITLEKATAISKLGVQYISVGALTHSAPTLDLSLQLVPKSV